MMTLQRFATDWKFVRRCRDIYSQICGTTRKRGSEESSTEKKSKVTEWGSSHQVSVCKLSRHEWISNRWFLFVLLTLIRVLVNENSVRPLTKAIVWRDESIGTISLLNDARICISSFLIIYAVKVSFQFRRRCWWNWWWFISLSSLEREPKRKQNSSHETNILPELIRLRFRIFWLSRSRFE